LFHVHSSYFIENKLLSFHRQPDCTADNGFTDTQFEDVFCKGLLGQQTASLNHQCKIRTGWRRSTVCTVSLHMNT